MRCMTNTWPHASDVTRGLGPLRIRLRCMTNKWPHASCVAYRVVYISQSVIIVTLRYFVYFIYCIMLRCPPGLKSDTIKFYNEMNAVAKKIAQASSHFLLLLFSCFFFRDEARRTQWQIRCAGKCRLFFFLYRPSATRCGW
jgi:hypothetical protein